MAYFVAIAIGLVFGASDQYLGTVHVTSRLGWWTITVSGMSAPWLIVPFLVGTTQDRARRAVALGLLVTMSALLGYFAMSNSVFEGVPIDRFWPRTVSIVRSGGNLLWIAGGAITAPLYAYFGHRWRGDRYFGGLNGSQVAWRTEVAVGIAASFVFLSMIIFARRARAPVGTR